MPTRLRDRADQVLSHRKARDQAMILPLAGLILLTPPVAGIFYLDTRIAGVPFILFYVFAVWALLIAGAAVLSRRLRADDTAGGTLAGSATAPSPEPEPAPQERPGV